MAGKRNIATSWENEVFVLRIDTTQTYGRTRSGATGIATAGAHCPVVRDGEVLNGWLLNCTLTRPPRQGDPEED